MAISGRAAVFTKLYKALKKQYKSAPSIPQRPILEQLVFACCLENSDFEAARTAFDVLRDDYYDWNEVRVTSVAELAEIMHALFDPQTAAGSVRSVLQGVFEGTYSFDLDSMKKKNIGQAVKELRKLTSASDFVIDFATQNGLGGHSIPLDTGARTILYVLGALTEKERDAGTAPGLERAIAKSKGIEFGLLLHAASAQFMAKPNSPEIRRFLTSIAPDAKDRFPKRASKAKSLETETKAKTEAEMKAEAKAERKAEPKTDTKAAKTSPKRAAAGKSAARNRATSSKKAAKSPSVPKKTKNVDGKTSAAGTKPAKKKASVAGKKGSQRTLARKKPR